MVCAASRCSGRTDSRRDWGGIAPVAAQRHKTLAER